MAEESIREDIREIREMVHELTKSMARTEQKTDSLNERLFNGGSGAVPTIWTKFSHVQAEITQVREEGAAEIVVVKKEFSDLKSTVNNRHAWTAGYAAAVVTLLGLVKYGAAKMGIHLP